MNTNSNTYTVIYTTIIVVIVAAVLAFVAMTLKPLQDANVKAETISQMLSAAQLVNDSDLQKMDNRAVLSKYSESVRTAFLINSKGAKVRELNTEEGSIELADNLKEQNYNIKGAGEPNLPVYVFDKAGEEIYVLPVYGAGLWGPVWGYIAFNDDCSKIVGAYFDHSGETPGLGAKIKDEPSFREQFKGRSVDVTGTKLFSIVKGGAPEGATGAVDAIAGATMTCKGLDAAINTWLSAYKPFIAAQMGASLPEGCDGSCGGNQGDCCGGGDCGGSCNGSCGGNHQCNR